MRAAAAPHTPVRAAAMPLDKECHSTCRCGRSCRPWFATEREKARNEKKVDDGCPSGFSNNSRAGWLAEHAEHAREKKNQDGVSHTNETYYYCILCKICVRSTFVGLRALVSCTHVAQCKKMRTILLLHKPDCHSSNSSTRNGQAMQARYSLMILA
jgi:hypothetical protein